MTPFMKKRLAAGLTQAALSKRLGISHVAVGKWDNGQSVPQPQYFPKLAKIFGMTAEEVVSLFDESAASSVK
jgi:transcriptional regulator with XRE-family HTH domain